MKQIEIETTQYEKMREMPLFFVKFHKNTSYDEHGYKYDYSEWRSIDRDLRIRFDASDFAQRQLGYCLCIIERVEQKVDKDGKIDPNHTIMYFHDASSNDANDCWHVLKTCITRSNDKKDKYSFVELLWLLDRKNVKFNALTTAIRKYDSRTIPFILDIFRRISHCLSLRNQNEIKRVCESCGGEYNVYMPTMITEAYQLTESNSKYDNYNIFQLVDKVVGQDPSKYPINTDDTSNNLLIKLCAWLHSNEAFCDYNLLKSLFSLVSEPIRLEIVKRYFHDIRLGNTQFDCNLLAQFKDNKFDDFIRFRYSIETPTEPVVLTVPLLCDSILTLYNSKGSTFQTFEGVLDFAITHCDKAHPDINFKLDRFIPTCEHGAVYNGSLFKGFVDYQLIRKMNESFMSADVLLDIIRDILDKYGRRQQYPICRYGDGTKLDDEQFSKCSKEVMSKDGKPFTMLECFTYREYDDRWFVKGGNVSILNTFLCEPLPKQGNETDIPIDIGMVSVTKFKEYILSIPTKYQNVGDDQFLVPSYKASNKNYDQILIEKFSDILRMRIIPQIGAMVGISFDVFGYRKEEFAALTPEQLQNNKSPEYIAANTAYIKRETEEVTRRTIKSLKAELATTLYNGTYFELPYQRETLMKLIHRFYFKEAFDEKDNISEHEFLTKSHAASNFKPYCAPQLSKVNNPAIDLPYFWCRGKECFHNNLEDQILEEISDWRLYSLYHMIEIIGYPKLHKTEAGNEPDSVVWSFIAVTNKAMQKFRRLKCRSCGHLMFTDKSSGFNRYNYYSCINPTCAEAWKPVYLNFCYQCKKGFIDSRDTKQCPNGWYICPTCISCCNDAQYDRLAQRYILSKRPVPDWIQKKLGQGHNDKGKYFCPNCGTAIEMITDEHGDSFKGCLNCKKNFDVQQDEYPY